MDPGDSPRPLSPHMEIQRSKHSLEHKASKDIAEKEESWKFSHQQLNALVGKLHKSLLLMMYWPELVIWTHLTTRREISVCRERRELDLGEHSTSLLQIGNI